MALRLERAHGSGCALRVDRLRQITFATRDGSEVVDERLNGVDTGVLPVGIGDLAGQGLGDASSFGDGFPSRRTGLTQTELELIEDGFRRLHARQSNPQFGIYL